MLSILEEQTMVFPSYQEVFDNASPGKQKEIQEPEEIILVWNKDCASHDKSNTIISLIEIKIYLFDFIHDFAFFGCKPTKI